MTYLPRPAAGHDPAALQERALRRRQSHIASRRGIAPLGAALASQIQSLRSAVCQQPGRYALHLLVGLLVPLAILAGQLPSGVLLPNAPAGQTSIFNPVYLIPQLAPALLDRADSGEAPAPDQAFADIDALPATSLAPSLLSLDRVIASVAADSATLRAGPGANYDRLGALPAGTQLRVLARTEGWYQTQTADGRIVWVAAELLSLDAAAADLLTAPAHIPAPPPDPVGTVAEASLNLRDGPGTDYVGLARLEGSAQVDLLARYGEWYQIQTAAGQVGWVLGQHLAIAPGVAERVAVAASVPDSSPALVGAVRERNVNLRAGPGTSYEKRGGPGTGTALELLARYQDWYQIRAAGGATGWVSSELVDVSAFVARRVPAARNIPALPKPLARVVAQPRAASRPAPEPAAVAGSVVRFASQFVGAPYAWGGAGPEGFDCSGFTRYVYGQFGLDLPHSSAGQYSSQYGTPISDPADLRPGDIVFFVNTYKHGISHVGLYIGGGEVVQAMSPKQGVGVASLNSGYWAQHYYGAIRPAR